MNQQYGSMDKITAILAQLSIEEKAALLEGIDTWNTNSIPRLEIPSLFLTDGPHGLRKVRAASGGFGISDNQNSTAFPTSATLASSWNPENARRMGEAIAEECQEAGVQVLLAPGVNIKRSPLCGRNFEYFSEDPLISGSFGSAFVQGVQAKGVGCSLKHFAANSNEQYRIYGNSLVDERAFREIYLRAFERIVKEAKPWTVMCAYNQINGLFSSQNHHLLTEILRQEWGFDGLVMTDWGATVNRVAGIQAGCDLDMPGGVGHNRQSIIAAIEDGSLTMEVLDRSVGRVLQLVQRCSGPKSGGRSNQAAHARLSCDIAKDSAVLLKNDGILPLTGQEKLLVVGEFFEKMRFQGAGSSLINPPTVITAQNAFEKRGVAFAYEKGFHNLSVKRDHTLEAAALKAADRADTIVFFGGLSDFEESEGFDRTHLGLAENQTALLKALLATGKTLVLVLSAGAPVELPFCDQLSALLNLYLPGMHGGEAATALLFGDVNPSGKLTESWPLSLEDSSCFADFGRGPVSKYYESIFVGYRFYDKAKTRLRFPFGFGLSYTSFAYDDLQYVDDDRQVTVQATIRNTGQRDGSEVVQLYVRNAASTVFKADKELRAFTKLFLKAGESRVAYLRFDKSDLAYWHVGLKTWVLESGSYQLCLAASAEDIRLSKTLVIAGDNPASSAYSANVTAAYRQPPKEIPTAFAEMVPLAGSEPLPVRPFTMESALADFRRSLMGRFVYTAIMHNFRQDFKKAMAMPDSLERDTRLKNAHFVLRLMPSMTLRAMCMASSGQLPFNIAWGLVELANNHPLRAIRLALGANRRSSPGSRN